ncbi:MAG: tetratricopeptide repeat protein [Bacteroidota bacterium]
MSSDRLKQLLNFYEESPDDSFIRFAIAKEYEKLQDDEQALAFYLRILDQDPAYVGNYYHLAKLYERTDDLAKALETYAAGMRVARQQGDQHAFSELSGAKVNLELEMDD